MFLAKHFVKYQVRLKCFARNFGTYYVGIHSVYKHSLAGVILLARTGWLKSQQSPTSSQRPHKQRPLSFCCIFASCPLFQANKVCIHTYTSVSLFWLSYFVLNNWLWLSFWMSALPLLLIPRFWSHGSYVTVFLRILQCFPHVIPRWKGHFMHFFSLLILLMALTLLVMKRAFLANNQKRRQSQALTFQESLPTMMRWPFWNKGHDRLWQVVLEMVFCQQPKA